MSYPECLPSRIECLTKCCGDDVRTTRTKLEIVHVFGTELTLPLGKPLDPLVSVNVRGLELPIYLQLIQNRYMFRSFTVLHCSHQHGVQPVASDVEVVGYL